MLKINLSGLDALKKKLGDMKKPEFIQQQMIEAICKEVPDAKAYKNKFKIKRLPNGKLELQAEGLPIALHEKITKAIEENRI
jgi:hypothetical protein